MKKLSIIFAFIICLAISSFAQIKAENKENSQCRYGEKDFVGESIDLSLTNADIRDVLAFVTQQYGCVFVLDKSVKEIPVSVNLKDIPWNIALEAILQSQGLAIKCNDSNNENSSFRVTTIDSFVCEFQNFKGCKKDSDCPALYTEFIKLKNIPENKAEYFEKLKNIITRRLSKRGAVEFENESETIVITDVRENLDALKKLIELLDCEKIENEDKKENP